MTIAIGTKLGRYEIRSQLGAGGMGEVYLAQDTTELDRTVALKILPVEVAADKDRLQRFEQLRFEPEIETRNRRPLLRPSSFGTAWELRFGPQNRFRGFYRVDAPARFTFWRLASKPAIACLLAERSLSYEDCTSS